MSYGWRHFDVEAVHDTFEQKRLVHPRTDLPLVSRYDRRACTWWAQDPRSGMRIGFTRTLTESYLLWAEGRLGAVLAGDSTQHKLVGQQHLARGEERAIELAGDLGLPMPTPGTATIRRCDLSADFYPDDPALGRMFMWGMSLIESPRYKRQVITATGSNDLETIYWSKPKSLEPVLRLYDKGVQSSSHVAGGRIRVERQYQPPAKQQLSSSFTSTRDLRPIFLAPLKAWVNLDRQIVAAGADQALEVLKEKIAADPKKIRPDEISERVAERMAGSLAVLRSFGDAFWKNPRTASRRRAELRRVGIVLDREAPPDVRIPLDEMLTSIIEAWDPSTTIGAFWSERVAGARARRHS